MSQPQEFTINRVSSKEPKRWKNDYGTMITYLVMLEGRDNPVQLNKKESSDAPVTGDTIYGHIEETSFGDKFKSDLRPSGPGGNKAGGQSTSYTPRDDASIKAQFSIKAAIQYVTGVGTTPKSLDEVEKIAKQLYVMVERVKGTTVQEPQVETMVDEVHEVNGNEDIDLSTIPF